MSRPNPFVLTAAFLLFIAVFGGLPLIKGGLYLDTHEGDSYHLLDILLRIDAGLLPHVDFPTPIGFLAFLPITAWIEAGFSAGTAILLAQVSVALLLLPVIVYLGVTRLTRGLALGFGLAVLVLVLSLSIGGAASGVSISMHYNRWSWALAFLAIALAILPGQGRATLDCALIGLIGGCLALLKITYFVALGPGVLVVVALKWKLRGLIIVGVAGLVMAGMVTLFMGPAFWAAYLADLRLVSGSEVRPAVGVPLGDVIAGASFLGATLLGLATYGLLRFREDDAAAYGTLLLVPGFIYVTYQNFGNDPLWVWLLGLVLLALRPPAGALSIRSIDLRNAMTGAALFSAALSLPSVFSHSTSALRHAGYDTARFVPILPETRGPTDVFLRRDRAYSTTARVQKDRDHPAWAHYGPQVRRGPLPELGGVTFPNCEWLAGSKAVLERTAQDLAEANLPPGAKVLVADNLSALWLFADITPVPGAAPWYYGQATGLKAADYLAVPKCAFVQRVRGIMVRDLVATGARFELLRDNQILALFRVDL